MRAASSCSAISSGSLRSRTWPTASETLHRVPGNAAASAAVRPMEVEEA
ncbi:hypothetical protein [Nonomuraea salmonea]